MSGKKVDVELLQKENLVVYKHLAEGKTFEDIAPELGYANASGVQKAYWRAIKRIEHPDREDYLKAHIERTDNLLSAYSAGALQGDIKRLYALLEVMKYQAAIMQLNAPLRIEQEVHHYGNRSLDAEVVRIARVIEYIEGTAANITAIAGESDKGEPNNLESPSAERAITAGE